MKKIVTFVVVTTLLLVTLFSVNVFASDTHLKSLDINAVLDDNGDMYVTETWVVSFSETDHRVGFKTISLKGLKGDILDVKVSSGSKEFDYEKYPYNKQNLNYLGDEGTYTTYEHGGDFWIEWYIDEFDSIRGYEISYRIENAVTVYNDTAELYWQFLSSQFSMKVKNINGTITIPKGANEDNFRVWAHGPLNGTVNREGMDKCVFKVKNFIAGDMLEVRIAMPNTLFPNSTNIVDKDYLDTILEEEQKYADEANVKRKKLMVIGYIDLGIGVLALAAGIFISVLLNSKFKRFKVVDDVEYYRDLPDKTLTPATVSHLYYFYNPNKRNRGNNVSATILELARRKVIYFDEVQEKDRMNLAIFIDSDVDIEEVNKLPEDLSSIYELVKGACGEDGYVTLKELERYTSKYPIRVKNLIDKMESLSKHEFERRNFQDANSESVRNIAMVLSFAILTVAFLGMIISNFYLLYAPIGLIIGSIISLISSFGILRLNQEGEQQFVYWDAFGKFIEDFSMMKEYEIPKLVMWEEYMVYATMMGKAEKAAKQIRTVYREFDDPRYYDNRRSSYLFYFMYLNSTRGGNFNTFGNLTKTINNINTSATRISQGGNMSSGKGFGGGFSGGGGGGRGGGGGGFR